MNVTIHMSQVVALLVKDCIKVGMEGLDEEDQFYVQNVIDSIDAQHVE